MLDRLEEPVPALLAGERLDRVVAMVADVSRAEVAGWLAAGAVTVDGTVTTKASTRLREGQTVAMPVAVAAPVQEPLGPDPSVAVVVVHEDDAVIVVDKPPGLVVHPGAGLRAGTLIQGLLARFPELADVGPDPDRPGVVHRIDRDTSGLLMVARTEEAYDDLVAQLQARTVEREYLALVWGHLATRSGMVDGPIGRSRRDATKRTISNTGKEARTRYEVTADYDRPIDASMLRCRLLTGRTHQIRVHMQSIEHPIVGDVTYGGARQSFPMPRMFLHAATLGFIHPVTGDPLRFSSALPADLQAVLDQLQPVD